MVEVRIAVVLRSKRTEEHHVQVWRSSWDKRDPSDQLLELVRKSDLLSVRDLFRIQRNLVPGHVPSLLLSCTQPPLHGPLQAVRPRRRYHFSLRSIGRCARDSVPDMTELRKTNSRLIVKDLGCVFWPIAGGLFLVWLAGRFEVLNCFHAAAIVAFGAGAMAFKLTILDRLRRCPHGVRGAISSPPLCSVCLAEKKSREHAEKLGRKRRGRERAASRLTGPANR